MLQLLTVLRPAPVWHAFSPGLSNNNDSNDNDNNNNYDNDNHDNNEHEKMNIITVRNLASCHPRDFMTLPPVEQRARRDIYILYYAMLYNTIQYYTIQYYIIAY